MGCDIEFCSDSATQTLTVAMADSSLELIFCPEHAKALNSQLARQLGGDPSTLDMYKTPIPYNVGDLQQAITVLESYASKV